MRGFVESRGMSEYRINIANEDEFRIPERLRDDSRYLRAGRIIGIDLEIDVKDGTITAFVEHQSEEKFREGSNFPPYRACGNAKSSRPEITRESQWRANKSEI